MIFAEALISGAAAVRLVIYLVVFGLIFWLLWWLIDFVKVPEPFNKVARVVLAILAVLVVINGLLMLLGTPLIGWP